MSYTIFTSNPSALIAQPGRAVNTFPSGLVRVDQAYLGLTSQAATHRATLAVGNDMPDSDSSPCIDGLKIFPEVQERRREDGFTEFIVSAYGRANAAGSKTQPLVLVDEYGGYNYRSVQLRLTIPTASIILPTPTESITYTFSTPDAWRAAPVSVYKFVTSGLILYLDGRAYINRPSELVNIFTVLQSRPLNISASTFTNYGALDEGVISYQANLSFPFGLPGGTEMIDASDNNLGTISDLFA
jgi:hypothetical protein